MRNHGLWRYFESLPSTNRNTAQGADVKLIAFLLAVLGGIHILGDLVQFKLLIQIFVVALIACLPHCFRVGASQGLGIDRLGVVLQHHDLLSSIDSRTVMVAFC